MNRHLKTQNDYARYQVGLLSAFEYDKNDGTVISVSYIALNGIARIGPFDTQATAITWLDDYTWEVIYNCKLSEKIITMADIEGQI